jgi:hypothetical protein
MECDGEAQSDVKLALRHTAMTRGGASTNSKAAFYDASR